MPGPKSSLLPVHVAVLTPSCLSLPSAVLGLLFLVLHCLDGGKVQPRVYCEVQPPFCIENAPCSLSSSTKCLWHTGGKLLAIARCKLRQALEPEVYHYHSTFGCQQSSDLALHLTDFIQARFTPSSHFHLVPRSTWRSLEALLFIQFLTVCCADS